MTTNHTLSPSLASNPHSPTQNLLHSLLRGFSSYICIRPMSTTHPFSVLPSMFSMLCLYLSVPPYCGRGRGGRGYHQTEIMKHRSTPFPPSVPSIWNAFQRYNEKQRMYQIIIPHPRVCACVLMSVVLLQWEGRLKSALPPPPFIRIPSDCKR